MMGTATFKTPPFCIRKAKRVTISSPSGLSDKPFKGLSASELKRHLAGAIIELDGEGALSKRDSAREIASVLQPIVAAYHADAIAEKTFAANLQKPERMKREQVEWLLDALGKEDEGNAERGRPTHSAAYVLRAIREAQKARNRTGGITRDALVDLIKGGYLDAGELRELADSALDILRRRNIPRDAEAMKPGVVLDYLRGTPKLSTSRRNRASVFDGESYASLEVTYSAYEEGMDTSDAEAI
ncbi:hypothetical protein [Thermophilibacter provencensis]|uniref:hypothetical protein n=1 Tax=Thermophilibacter provencensis TaxID=1852386 RepID=UPI0029438CBB|nr:hypothetical protein [Thermophilibacter provencensis]